MDGNLFRESSRLGLGQEVGMFVAAEKLNATRVLRTGLVDAIADDPVAEAVRRLKH